MTDAFVFRVGPFALSSGPLSLYFTHGADLEPVPGDDDFTALREISERVGNMRISVEPGLEDAARRLGLPVRQFSTDLARVAAIAALNLGVAPALEAIEDLHVLDALCEAAHAFARANPPGLGPDVEYRVSISGSVNRTYEAMLQSQDSGAFGFVLYEEPGALRRLPEVDDPSPEPADSLALFLLEEPSFVVSALHRAYGLEWLPRPARIREGSAAFLVDAEVVTLAATAKALAELTERRVPSGATRVEVGELVAEAQVHVSSGSRCES